jgi:hypothetical protein
VLYLSSKRRNYMIEAIPFTEKKADLVYGMIKKGRSILVSDKIKDQINDLIITCNAAILFKNVDYVIDLIGEPRILLSEHISGDEDTNFIDFYKQI